LESSLSPAGAEENAKRHDKPGGQPAGQRNPVVEVTNGEIADGRKGEIGRNRPGAGDTGLPEPGIVAFRTDNQQRNQAKGREQRQDAGQRIAAPGQPDDRRRDQATGDALPEMSIGVFPERACYRISARRNPFGYSAAIGFWCSGSPRRSQTCNSDSAS
jgi:hypothetical protein